MESMLLHEMEGQVRLLLRKHDRAATDCGYQITKVRSQIDNLVAAIASGALGNSPAIARRLQDAERELARLQAASQPPRPLVLLMPDLRHGLSGWSVGWTRY